MQGNQLKYDAYAVLKDKDFRLFLIFRFLMTLAIQMQSVIVAWQVYYITKDPLSLGLTGLWFEPPALAASEKPAAAKPAAATPAAQQPAPKRAARAPAPAKPRPARKIPAKRTAQPAPGA